MQLDDNDHLAFYYLALQYMHHGMLNEAMVSILLWFYLKHVHTALKAKTHKEVACLGMNINEEITTIYHVITLRQAWRIYKSVRASVNHHVKLRVTAF